MCHLGAGQRVGAGVRPGPFPGLPSFPRHSVRPRLYSAWWAPVGSPDGIVSEGLPSPIPGGPLLQLESQAQPDFVLSSHPRERSSSGARTRGLHLSAGARQLGLEPQLCHTLAGYAWAPHVLFCKAEIMTVPCGAVVKSEGANGPKGSASAQHTELLSSWEQLR